MNSLVIVTLTLLVTLAASSPCSDMCLGACNIAKTDCDGAVVLGPLCDISYGQCAMGCTTMCACDDGCEGQCKPAFDSCNTQAGDNPVFRLECTAQYDACTVQCHAGCAVQTAVDTVGQVLGGGAAPARK